MLIRIIRPEAPNWEGITNGGRHHQIRLAGRVREYAPDSPRRGGGARRRLSPVGRLHAVSRAWHGRSDGPAELKGRLVQLYRRSDWLYDGDADDLVDERLGLSDHSGRQTALQPDLRVPSVVR